MVIVDLSKAVRRKTDRRRHEVRRISVQENGVLARIAHLQRVLDSSMRTGDKEGLLAGRRELNNLIFTVVSEDVCMRERN